MYPFKGVGDLMTNRIDRHVWSVGFDEASTGLWLTLSAQVRHVAQGLEMTTELALLDEARLYTQEKPPA